jgi:hypothetical protein
VVSAITWEFDTDGDAQGWLALQSMSQTSSARRSRLEVTVRDGRLRITAPEPIGPGLAALELISPEIKQPSALFDRLGASVTSDK